MAKINCEVIEQIVNLLLSKGKEYYWENTINAFRVYLPEIVKESKIQKGFVQDALEKLEWSENSNTDYWTWGDRSGLQNWDQHWSELRDSLCP